MNALNAYNKLNANVAGLKKSSEKLSSGYRINRAGDDAAGLAVSEKMRSQIRGLNQAVRNSQDGINMIQTFEGAAQETHSILQRMKELAEESATGTYDNYTDRAAMQLEFDQLNDELNQIADTDFNGTIVLNGGEMADGLKAVDGEFNYANANAAGSTPTIKDAVDYSSKKLGSQILATGTDKKASVGVLNNNALSNLADADAEADGFTLVKGDTTKTGVDKVDHYEKTVGYIYDKDNNVWYCSEDNTKQFKANENGGFIGLYGDTITVASNDTAPLNDGDYVTVVYKKGLDGTAAELPVSNDADFELQGTAGAYKASVSDKAGSFVLEDDFSMANDGTELTEDQINAIIDAVGKLNGAKIKIVAGAAQTAATDLHDLKGSDLTVTVTAGGGDSLAAFSKAAAGFTPTAGKITAVGNDDGTIDFYYALDATAVAAAADPNSAANLVKIGTMTVGDIHFDSGAATTDGVEFTLNVAQGKQSTKPGDCDIVIGTSADKNIKTSLRDKLRNPEVAGAGATADGAANAVTEANAYKNSTARMTYTDNITLQTGARTKDAVNFTFSYNRDGTADMGDLKANLNLSSRADGLNTANLSIANQSDANSAIDQIDKAINKTSMVRATFGSIQNRLEHKITNLTNTSENLTEAESSIRDTDMASEMMNYTKFNILQQAAQSMLAQANQQPQSILQLLG